MRPQIAPSPAHHVNPQTLTWTRSYSLHPRSEKIFCVILDTFCAATLFECCDPAARIPDSVSDLNLFCLCSLVLSLYCLANAFCFLLFYVQLPVLFLLFLNFQVRQSCVMTNRGHDFQARTRCPFPSRRTGRSTNWPLRDVVCYSKSLKIFFQQHVLQHPHPPLNETSATS